MANEIKVIYLTGKSLTAKVYYDNNGVMTLRDNVGALTEEPAGSLLYKATSRFIQAGDIVIILEGTTLVGGSEYRPYQVIKFIKDG